MVFNGLPYGSGAGSIVIHAALPMLGAVELRLDEGLKFCEGDALDSTGPRGASTDEGAEGAVCDNGTTLRIVGVVFLKFIAS
jgi:hypothetical protein